jgi:hypothetical protein
MGLLVVLVWGSNTSCDSDPNGATTWQGTYIVSDQYGGGSGTVSFFVADNDTIYYIALLFLEPSRASPCLAETQGLTAFPSIATSFRFPSRRTRALSSLKVNSLLQLRPRQPATSSGPEVLTKWFSHGPPLQSQERVDPSLESFHSNSWLRVTLREVRTAFRIEAEENSV